MFILFSFLISSNIYAITEEGIHYRQILTDTELEWIKQNPVVSVAGDPDWFPIEGFNQNNKYVGIVAEMLQLLSQKSGLRFEPLKTDNWEKTVQLASLQEVDIISGSTPNPVIEKNYRTTHITIKKPIVMIASGKMNYVSNLNAIKNLRIALLRNSGYVSDIIKHYPNIDFIKLDEIKDLLFGVEKGLYDIALLSMPIASYQISEFGLYDLRVVGITDIDLQLTLFVNLKKPLLWGIINKLKKQETREELHHILSKWVEYKFIDRYSPQRMRLLFVTVCLLLIFIFYRQQLLKKQTKMLLLSSQTDSLTKLHNRLYLDIVLEQKAAECERYKNSFSLIIIDIDHFKAVNDSLGHLVGDQLLIDFSALLKKFTRSCDTVGRWGGEEFLIICPETQLSDASLLANKLRAQIESFPFKDIDQKTASFGVAEFAIGECVDSCLGRADSALFDAKKGGRNQVMTAKSPEL